MFSTIRCLGRKGQAEREKNAVEKIGQMTKRLKNTDLNHFATPEGKETFVKIVLRYQAIFVSCNCNCKIDLG